MSKLWKTLVDFSFQSLFHNQVGIEAFKVIKDSTMIHWVSFSESIVVYYRYNLHTFLNESRMESPVNWYKLPTKALPMSLAYRYEKLKKQVVNLPARFSFFLLDTMITKSTKKRSHMCHPRT